MSGGYQSLAGCNTPAISPHMGEALGAWDGVKRGGLLAPENRAIPGIDTLDFSSLYADWGQIRGLERGSSCLWILTQRVCMSRHCCFRDVLNEGELKVEDAVTHNPEYLLSSSHISLLLFLRFFFFFFLIQSYSNTEVTTVHRWMLL